jgi:RimJ/RimL family protein N-acetyltransferase
LKREVLDHVDIGYALLPRYWSKGYALEAVKRTIEYVKNSLGLDRLAAIVNEDNESSIRLLEKLGFRFEKMIRLNDEVAEIQLFLSDRL